MPRRGELLPAADGVVDESPVPEESDVDNDGLVPDCMPVESTAADGGVVVDDSPVPEEPDVDDDASCTWQPARVSPSNSTQLLLKFMFVPLKKSR